MLSITLKLPYAGERCLRDSTQTLTYLAGPQDVAEVDLSTALRNAKDADYKCVLLAPGGAALRMVQSLSEAECTALRDTVRAGAGYMGFCAGSMLGAESLVVHYQSGQKAKSYTRPMLGLLQGVVADGPAYRDYIGRPIAAENRRPTRVTTHTGDSVVAYWLHGPAFRGAAEKAPPPCTIEAEFADGGAHVPTAAISGECGRGKVILCGVHPEMAVDGESIDEAREREMFMADLYEKVMPQ